MPLVKDKLASRSDMSNYRGITLSSTISKVLELVLADMCKSNLQSSDLQFGFKHKHSTTMCSFLVRETIEYFNTRGSPVFSCFMDASKAFDRVSHDTLFGIMKDRGLNPLLLRLLEYWYKNLKGRVKWGQVLSDTLPITNGVRQGGVHHYCFLFTSMISW